MALSERLRAVVGSFTAEQASYKVYARAKYYPNFISVYIPKNPYDRLLPGMEATKKLAKSKTSSRQEVEDNLERSIRRTKSLIKDYVLCSEFDLFVTFTFKADRHDITKSRAKMSNWLNNQQKRNGKFEYLIIPELHKDGALHFHGLLKKYPGTLVDSGIKTKNKQTIYNIKGYRNGFTTAVKIPPEDINRVGNYVRKYITKDMPLFSNKNRYWRSEGLKQPLIEENPSGWYLQKIPEQIIETIYGRILYFVFGGKSETR